jgi:two-component system OmpR family response regulator
LVIEDNPANRDFLVRLLATAGFEVLSGATAASALEHAKTVSTLDLAVVDMELPDMNGIQLTGALHGLHAESYIIVATMHDERSLADSVFAKGGNVFLVKPHGFMDLYKRLTTNDLNKLCHGPCMVIDQYGPREVLSPVIEVATA